MLNYYGSMYQWVENGIEDLEKPLVVTSCGYQEFITVDYKIHRDKGRCDYQLIYLLKGKGVFLIDNMNIEVTEGNIVIFSPYQPQNYKYTALDSTELFWVHFTGNGVRDSLSDLNLLKRQINFVDINAECVELFNRIIYELKLKRPAFESFASSYFTEILSLFSRELFTKDARGVILDNSLNRTLAMVQLNYKQNLHINEYAKNSNLSLFRFIHKFKMFTGTTPVEYITRLRIDESIYLLLNSSLAIKEISPIVGYEDPLYFSRIFKKVTGVSPSEYRTTSSVSTIGPTELTQHRVFRHAAAIQFNGENN